MDLTFKMPLGYYKITTLDLFVFMYMYIYIYLYKNWDITFNFNLHAKNQSSIQFHVSKNHNLHSSLVRLSFIIMLLPK